MSNRGSNTPIEIVALFQAPGSMGIVPEHSPMHSLSVVEKTLF